jgi:hypothetical protein
MLSGCIFGLCISPYKTTEHQATHHEQVLYCNYKEQTMIQIYTGRQGSKVYISAKWNGFLGAIGSGGVRETKTDK